MFLNTCRRLGPVQASRGFQGVGNATCSSTLLPGWGGRLSQRYCARCGESFSRALGNCTAPTGDASASAKHHIRVLSPSCLGQTGPAAPGHVGFAVPVQSKHAHSFRSGISLCLRCEGSFSQLTVAEQRADGKACQNPKGNAGQSQMWAALNFSVVPGLSWTALTWVLWSLCPLRWRLPAVLYTPWLVCSWASSVHRYSMTGSINSEKVQIYASFYLERLPGATEKNWTFVDMNKRKHIYNYNKEMTIFEYDMKKNHSFPLKTILKCICPRVFWWPPSCVKTSECNN